MIPDEWARVFAEEWLAAWNAHDLDRILAHYAEDVEFESPFVARLLGGGGSAVRGKAALREYFGTALERYPDLRFQPERVLCGARSVVLLYESVSSLRAAEVMELDEEGKVRRVLAHYGR